MNVLFLCTGNSCRSLMGEALFNYLAPSGWQGISAGSAPTGRLNEQALALLASKGIPTQGYYSKSWDALPVTPDIVITVCASAAGEACPAYLGPVLRSHWGVEDPSHVAGSMEQVKAAFETTYAILRARIEAFMALPLEELKTEPVRLKAALDQIGHIGPRV